jgi:6-pyruvoyltetrahydropterin/6-carboxytetrahydropterin synthase
MYRISKEFSFSMGHRLSCHEGLCKNLHGHNYTIIVGLKSSNLNPNGMVMDFGDLKAIGEHYFKNFDHATMINRTDHDNFVKLRSAMPFLKILEVDYEPTAENMSREMYFYFSGQVKKYSNNVEVDFITIFETDKSQATYSED